VTGRIVVAGIGNIFFADDGFGVEVVTRLARHPLPPGVQVIDVGIRGVHLAYDLLDGCDLLVLIDAAPRGLRPGTLAVLELGRPAPSPGAGDGERRAGDRDPAVRVTADAHAMTPESVLALVHALGARIGRTLLVACEPAEVAEAMGLSPAVQAAVGDAVTLVRQIVAEAAGTVARAGPRRRAEVRHMRGVAR
jgi:hydrogenase maturation protease